MDEAQEKAMDSVACFKRGALLSITGQQYNVCSKNLKRNLLVSSNRYGYVFYGTETDGLAVIPSAYIDHQSRRHVMPSDDDGGDNPHVANTSIIHRSYLPGQAAKQNTSLVPYWLSLNADETILAIILFQTDAQASHLIFYDVAQYIQKPDAPPICPVMRLTSDIIGDSIRHFTWNPVIPNIFAYIDGLGSVSTFAIDKQMKTLGKSNADTNNSSICWSPKGKQIVVVKYDGSLEFFDENMQPKKKNSSVVSNQSFPPCINILWVSTHQFLLGFSTTNSNSDPNALSHVMATYSKDHPPKAQIFYDFFFDVTDMSTNTNLQYYYTSMNQNKIVMCGLSKSMKTNVIGADELNSDSYNTWTFPDHLRADTKGDLKIDSKQLILTGMALGLNSTLTIPEFKKKLPPCPMLLLSNSEGALLVYYFLHQQLQFACHAPEIIKPIQAGNIFGSAAPTSSLALTGTFSSSQPPSNGFQMTQLNSTVAPSRIPIASQGKEKPNLTSAFNFTQAPPQITNGSPFSETSKASTVNLGSEPTPTQKQSPIKNTVSQEQPSTPKMDIKNLFQTIDQFQSKLNILTNSLSKAPTSFGDFDKSLENLTKTLQDMNNTFEKSSQSVKTMTHEHIEYMTKIENARYQLRSSLKENLYHSLKDRELDPWTQARLDSIKTKYDQLKHDLDVLLQVTHATIRDRSAPDTSEDAENEDFLPDLEISLITTGTMKQRLCNRIRELSHKVSQTEHDLQQICAKLNTDILSSKTFDKTTMSSERPFHNTDAQILAHLQATHKTITQVRVPLAVGINLSSTVESTKKQPVNEAPKVTTPSAQPSTPQQLSSPSVDSESFKNMLRLVRTSIDLFSGVTSPEQLQELSNTIATSPLSAAPKSNTTPISKTPTTVKATNLTKTTTLPKTSQTITALQTPGRSTISAPPVISVTPATPATQTFASDVPLSFSQVKPAIVSAATDLTKPQIAATSGDNAIRSLLNSTVSPSSNTAPVTKPLANTTTPNQVALSSSFGVSSLFNQAGTSSPSTTTVTSLSSTITTSVQSTSPTVKPLTSSGAGAFGSKPALGGSSSLNLGSLSASIPFDNSSSVTPLATTISTPSPSGTVFGTTSSTAPISTASAGPFGGSTTTPVTTSASTGSAFGSLSGPFGATVAVTTTAPTSGLFATPTTASAGIFGGAVTTAGIFGSTTTTTATSPFGSTPATSASGMGIFGTAAPSTALSTGIFGSTTTSTSSPFGAALPTTSAVGTSIFGAATSTAAPSTTTTSPFGATPTTPGGSGTGVFGSGFGATAPSSSTAGPFGSVFTSSSSSSTATPAGSIFGGFGGSSTASASSPTTGGFSVNLSAASPTSSTAFGASPSFGSGFSGFNTQSKSSGATTGFSFGGFAGQSSNSGAPAPTFASFGAAATVASQPASSPFGGSIFGSAAPTQPSGFGSSPFGGPSPAQSPTSSSFTSYRDRK